MRLGLLVVNTDHRLLPSEVVCQTLFLSPSSGLPVTLDRAARLALGTKHSAVAARLPFAATGARPAYEYWLTDRTDSLSSLVFGACVRVGTPASLAACRAFAPMELQSSASRTREMLTEP